MRKVKNNSREKSTIRKLLGHFSSKKRTLLLVIVCTAMWGLVWSITPYITGLAFDVIYYSLENHEMANPKIFFYLLLLTIIALSGFLAQGLAFFFVGNLHQDIFKKLREEVFDSLQRQSHKYFGEHSTGRIKIKTEVLEDSVIVSIKDNGIGFTEDEKQKIFQQFGKIERYGQGLDLDIGGTGLGLYISKQIIESHGGKIWMDSEGKNKGSIFFFSLPYHKNKRISSLKLNYSVY